MNAALFKSEFVLSHKLFERSFLENCNKEIQDFFIAFYVLTVV